MEGVYTTSINENTLDEAPMAYKSLEDIIDMVATGQNIVRLREAAGLSGKDSA